MKKFMIILFLYVLLLGCATVQPPSPEQLATADYGKYPDNYEEIIINSMSDLLIDPQSAIYSHWRGPVEGWVTSNGGYIFGYKVCTDVNAKNRFGGYTGRKTYFFVIRNGEIIRYARPENAPTETWCNFY